MSTSPASLWVRPCRCAPDPDDLPVSLLEVTFEDGGIAPPIVSLSAGYERGWWRAEALADHVMDWVLDYALRPAERRPLSPGRAMETTRRAVRATFGNGRDRGVPGEILLHAVCRSIYGSDTIINKIWFKTADNDTYKGFDGVHCVHSPSGDLELWLGEAKFYKQLRRAIADATADIEQHFESNYLHNEFAIISDKIDDEHPHIAELKQLMHKNTSLDEVFTRVVVPVLLAYDSPAAAKHNHTCQEFKQDIEAEARQAWLSFKARVDPSLPITIRVFLMPMNGKQQLVEAIQQRLLGWQ